MSDTPQPPGGPDPDRAAPGAPDPLVDLPTDVWSQSLGETTGGERGDEIPLGQLLDTDTDPALASAVLEVERHVATEGWDGPGRLFALVDTARVVREAPDLAAQMGLDRSSEDGSLTPVEQDELPEGETFEDALGGIVWPPDVDGCIAVLERLVLPPEADDEIPEDPAAAHEFASNHPERQEVRMTVGVTRAGASYCALRLRSHDDDESVVGGVDLVPALIELLGSTLDEEDPVT